MAVHADAAFDEIDFGRWTMRSFDDLASRAAWQRWNAQRGLAFPEQGEGMAAALARALGGIERLVTAHPEAKLAVLSHGDIIKAVLAHVLGMPMDLMQRIDIAPGSISMLEIAPWGARILGINERPVPR